MSFTELKFTKKWTDPEDFPTFEDSEEQVRADMQLLFDECRDGVNRLAGEIKAENIPFRRSAGINAATVQNALEVLRDSIAEVTLGEVPDGSVVGAKIADGAVTEPKLGSGAVTAAKLAALAVTEAKIANSAVTTAKIANSAVTAAKVADGSLTLAKFAGGALSGKADLDSDGKVLPEQKSKAIVNVTASRSLALTDAGKLLNISGTSAITITIPLNVNVTLPIGTEIDLFRAGTGAVTVDYVSGVTMRTASNNLTIPAQYGCLRLKKITANPWIADNALVTTGEIADSAVTAAKLAGSAVTTAKIANEAVTYAKTSGVQAKHTTLTVSLAAANWSSSNTISVTANGVTASNTVLVSPAPASWTRYRDCGVRCSAQGANSLTFTAESKPTAAISVNIVIFS